MSAVLSHLPRETIAESLRVRDARSTRERAWKIVSNTFGPVFCIGTLSRSKHCLRESKYYLIERHYGCG